MICIKGNRRLYTFMSQVLKTLKIRFTISVFYRFIQQPLVVGIETKFWYTITNNFNSRMFYSNIDMLLFFQLLKIRTNITNNNYFISYAKRKMEHMNLSKIIILLQSLFYYCNYFISHFNRNSTNLNNNLSYYLPYVLSIKVYTKCTTRNYN